MYRIMYIISFFMVLSACGNADVYDEIDPFDVVDSILVNPPATNDSIEKKTSDSIIIKNDSIVHDKDSTIFGSISIGNQPEIEYSNLFKLTSPSHNSFQGFAIYGKYLFSCHHSNDVIDVFDLETKKSIKHIELEADNIIHSNNVNFGSEFYAEGDKFPLLYIQQRGYACKLNVYRIICYNDSIFSAQKVQTIAFETCNACLNTIDIKSNILYALYKINDKKYISTHYLPPVGDGDVCINLRSSYKTYHLPTTKVCQDTAFDGNYLYIVCGYSSEGELWRIDLEKKLARVIDLTQYGLMGEPEGIDIYNGDIIISFLSGSLYKIIIL